MRLTDELQALQKILEETSKLEKSLDVKDIEKPLEEELVKDADEDLESKRLANKEKATDINRKIDENARKESVRLYTQDLITYYLKTVFLLFVINPFILNYPPSVIIALITTTTATVIGAFVVVVKGVYK
tara:strand:+ start:4870 stop:5259 length:390 start_codon:yes stop_codon:yes gene_type:complete